jgi:hypothetical protein
MLNPSALRAALVAALKDIPAVVSLVGNSANILEHIEEAEGDLYSAIRDLEPGRILVFIQEVGITGYPGLWSVKIGIVPRVESDPFAAFSTIVNGVPSAGGLALHFRDINPAYHPMQLGPDAFTRKSIAVNESSDFDFWQMNLYFNSKGTE